MCRIDEMIRRMRVGEAAKCASESLKEHTERFLARHKQKNVEEVTSGKDRRLAAGFGEG